MLHSKFTISSKKPSFDQRWLFSFTPCWFFVATKSDHQICKVFSTLNEKEDRLRCRIKVHWHTETWTNRAWKPNTGILGTIQWMVLGCYCGFSDCKNSAWSKICNLLFACKGKGNWILSVSYVFQSLFHLGLENWICCNIGWPISCFPVVPRMKAIMQPGIKTEDR